MDFLKYFTSKSSLELAGSIFFAIVLAVIIMDNIRDKIPESIPMQNIAIPIIVTTIFTISYGMIFKKNAIVMFAVVLAFTLYYENQDKINEYLPDANLLNSTGDE